MEEGERFWLEKKGQVRRPGEKGLSLTVLEGVGATGAV